MPDPELIKLIGGPYCPPRVKVGDVETCLYRDADVVITSWPDGRIPWPRCRARDQVGGGGSGLFANDTLLRAIRTESAAALNSHENFRVIERHNSPTSGSVHPESMLSAPQAMSPGRRQRLAADHSALIDLLSAVDALTCSYWSIM